MPMINSENSFFDIFSLFLACFAPKNAFGDENISFFSFGTFLTLCQIKILRILTHLVYRANGNKL